MFIHPFLTLIRHQTIAWALFCSFPILPGHLLCAATTTNHNNTVPPAGAKIDTIEKKGDPTTLLPLSPNSIEQGWELMRLGHWNDAEEIFTKLQASAPRDELPDIKFAKATLWGNRAPGLDIAKAQGFYKEIFTTWPSSPRAPWAMLEYARIPDLAVLHSDPIVAIVGYRQVMKDYPTSNAAQEASSQLPLALWDANGTEGAREGVNEVIAWRKQHPNANYDGIVELTIGKLYRYPLKDYAQASQHLQNAFTAGLHTDPQRSTTIWTIATLAEHELKDRDLAVRYYTRFLEDFPGDTVSFRAKQALIRLNAPLPKIDPIAPPTS